MNSVREHLARGNNYMNIKSSLNLQDRSNSDRGSYQKTASQKDAISQRITDRDNGDDSSTSPRDGPNFAKTSSENYLNTASLSSTGKRDMNGSLDSQILIQDNHWNEKHEEMKILNSVMSKIQNEPSESSTGGIALFSRNQRTGNFSLGDYESQPLS